MFFTRARYIFLLIKKICYNNCVLEILENNVIRDKENDNLL